MRGVILLLLGLPMMAPARAVDLPEGPPASWGPLAAHLGISFIAGLVIGLRR